MVSLSGAARVSGQLVLTTPPLIQERMPEGTGRVLRRPPGTPRDVEHPLALGIFAASFDDRLADRGVDQRLGRRLEASAHEYSGGTESKGGCDAPPVGDAASRQDGRWRRQVDHDRDERQGRPPVPRAVPAAFGALRDYYVSAEIHGLPRFLQVGGLDDQGNSRLANRRCEGVRIAE